MSNFKEKLANMDWSYDMSDDIKAWRAGHAKLSDILVDLKGDQKLMPLFRQYSNKYPNQDVLNAILNNVGVRDSRVVEYLEALEGLR